MIVSLDDEEAKKVDQFAALLPKQSPNVIWDSAEQAWSDQLGHYDYSDGTGWQSKRAAYQPNVLED